MKHTLIIGGGAAGMAAAIAAARSGQRVTVLERGRKPLKKLAVTGNGRGNLLNCGAPEYYGDEAFALDVLRHMPWQRVRDFWRSVGVPLVQEDEGRMYPSCLLASAAVDALRLHAARLAVDIHSCTRATCIQPHDGRFTVHALRAVYAPETQRKSGKAKPGALLEEQPVSYEADRVIVAVGGAASPMHGTDGSAYALLTVLGHTLTPVRPALCALLTETAPIRSLTGQRVRAALTLSDARGQVLHTSRGEALFAADGVSGIAAMQLARFVEPGCVLHMDLRAAVTGDPDADVDAWLDERARLCPDPADWLVGAATQELAAALQRSSGGLADSICDFALRVTGTRGMESAQVTAGGIRASEFDAATLQSRLVPGLYAAGELLDVDGECGGYNLLFAVASGLIAGAGCQG